MYSAAAAARRRSSTAGSGSAGRTTGCARMYWRWAMAAWRGSGWACPGCGRSGRPLPTGSAPVYAPMHNRSCFACLLGVTGQQAPAAPRCARGSPRARVASPGRDLRAALTARRGRGDGGPARCGAGRGGGRGLLASAPSPHRWQRRPPRPPGCWPLLWPASRAMRRTWRRPRTTPVGRSPHQGPYLGPNGQKVEVYKQSYEYRRTPSYFRQTDRQSTEKRAASRLSRGRPRGRLAELNTHLPVTKRRPYRRVHAAKLPRTFALYSSPHQPR